MIDLSRSLFVLAHPDDECLGCGGLLSLLGHSSNLVRILIMCSGVEKRNTNLDSSQTISNFYAAIASLGIHADSVKLFDFPNLKLNTLPQYLVVEAVESEVRSFAPSCIITHDCQDLNIDHQCISSAVFVASRLGFRDNNVNVQVPSVLSCEVPSSTDWAITDTPFNPNIYIPFSQVNLEQKIVACSHYPDVMRQPPHSRSVESLRSLAIRRGSECNSLYAEAYKLHFSALYRV